MKTAPPVGASAGLHNGWPAPDSVMLPRRLSLAFFLITTSLSAQQGGEAPRKLETLLMMPEPRAMRTPLSITPQGAKQTVLTPCHESASAMGGVESYQRDTFAKLGLSIETFAQRAGAAADKRLLKLKPELIKGADGKIAYAVYRGESMLYATLLVAPSLPKIFAEIFGQEIWAAMPDRHALYIFPARPDILSDFQEDLAARYASEPFAASCEVFSLKAGEPPKVVATFAAQE